MATAIKDRFTHFTKQDTPIDHLENLVLQIKGDFSAEDLLAIQGKDPGTGTTGLQKITERNIQPLVVLEFTDKGIEQTEVTQKETPEIPEQLQTYILVTTNELGKDGGESMRVHQSEPKMLVCQRKSLRECLSSVYEKEIENFLENLMQAEVYVHGTPGFESLKTDAKALIHRIRRCCNVIFSVEKHRVTDKSRKDLSETAKSLIERNKTRVILHGMHGDTVRLVVRDEEDVAAIKEKASSLNLENIKIQPKSQFFESLEPYLKQGDKLIRDTNKERNVESYGTLGGFASMNEELVGITCSHVYQNAGKAYAELNGKVIEIGSVCLAIEPNENKSSLIDVCFVKIKHDLHKNCTLYFVNHDNEPSNAIIHNSQIRDLQNELVHKYGATTGLTTGIICGWMEQDDEECDLPNSLSVRDFAGKTFAAPGDSGSIIFRQGDSFEQRSIEILGVLWGVDVSNAFGSNETICTEFGSCVSELKRRQKDLTFFDADHHQ